MPVESARCYCMAPIACPANRRSLAARASALPHGGPTERAVLPGELLLFDFVCTVDGYYADITRTFVVGKQPDERQRTIYQAVQMANEVGRSSISPGVVCEAVDTAVRSVIEFRRLWQEFYSSHRAWPGA